jgi:tRNA A-37 threonylcarbamoyl transferase component Bud32
MSDELHNPDPSAADEAEFEASLVSDAEGESVGDETEIVPSEATPSRACEVPKQPAWVGKVLGHFRLLRLIGQGNMGRVIQAQDVNLHRIVALKILCKRLAGVDNKRHVEQFLREARAAAQIEHPNVVQVYEINQHEGWWYIAMELLEAGNLRQVVKAAGPLSVPRACSLIADAAAGLAAAHQLGIVHRDVKPANLMLTRQGRCKLSDFGLVRLDDPNDPFDFTRKAVGSPAFMAPEVILHRRQTPAIDVYSLGATLFYALTGKMPYTAHNLKGLLHKHVHEAVPDIRTLAPGCPASLVALVGRMLAKNPADRPSAADVAAALRAESIAAQPEDSGTLAMTGTGSLQSLLATQAGQPQTPGVCGRIRSVVKAKPCVVFAAATLLVIAAGGLLFFARGAGGLRKGGKTPHPADLARLFPDAPQSYGVLPPGTVPEFVPADSKAPPAFSWVRSIERGRFKFVSTRSGRRCYPADSTEAILIPLEDFVGYETAEAARADGKTPGP